jgi:hypothetical protein
MSNTKQTVALNQKGAPMQAFFGPKAGVRNAEALKTALKRLRAHEPAALTCPH